MISMLAMTFPELMTKGGYVMWPLLAMSVVSVALVIERVWFFVRTNSTARTRAVVRMVRLLRRGQRSDARQIAAADPTIYGDAAMSLLEDGPRLTESASLDAVEAQRPRLERFMPTLSTIITAAPMLGILGTVLGIISAFYSMSDQSLAAGGVEQRMAAVGHGIGEALITTAAGMIVAVITLFPYNALRAQIDRTLGRLESLAAAAAESVGTGVPGEAGVPGGVGDPPNA